MFVSCTSTAWGIYVDPVGVRMAIFVCVFLTFMAFWLPAV